MIQLGQKHQITEIAKCLSDSQLQEEYFYDKEITHNFILESIQKNELYVLVDLNNNILGFIRVDLNGMLSRFPLLRCLAINPLYRNSGHGKKLLYYYEDIAFKNANKIFLCVSDFNIIANEIYQKAGYTLVGKINDLYKQGVNENIMVKANKV